MFANRPDRPETMIIRRVKERMNELGIKTRELSERLHDSELYGDYTYGSLRNLLTQNFEDDRKPRDTLNKQLVIALSECLECSVERLANHRELEAVREVPYRKRQYPQFMLDLLHENAPRTSVASPDMTAKRIWAYARLYGYTTVRQFHKALTQNKVTISESTLTRIMGPKAEDSATRNRLITFEFCDQVAKVFRGRMQRDPFDVQWLLKCRDDGRCPHCHPIMLEVG